MVMEVGLVSSDTLLTRRGSPSLCRTCVYLRYVNPVIGREDMPRLRGVYRKGHSEEPCDLCSWNPRFHVFYVSRITVRQLKGFELFQRERPPPPNVSVPLDGVAAGGREC